jgi:predicted methyltransferase
MRKLAEVLSGPDTWCQGELMSNRPTLRRCLVGAILACFQEQPIPVMQWTAIQCSELNRMRRIINDLFGTDFNTIAEWQDAPDRTWDEIALVVDAYDRDRMLNP